MGIWAFGTSPYGLGLADQDLWSLTEREFRALEKQWQAHHDRFRWMHAGIQATLHNANFLGEGDTPYVPADFMDAGMNERQKRIAARKRELLEVGRANAALARMKPGVKPEGLPEWAN